VWDGSLEKPHGGSLDDPDVALVSGLGVGAIADSASHACGVKGMGRSRALPLALSQQSGPTCRLKVRRLRGPLLEF
jgi:hypothetical protein